MNTWEFTCTTLERLGDTLSILGACNLGAKIKDLCMYVWWKKLNSL